MSSVENIGPSSEVKEQYENMKKFVEGRFFISSLFVAKAKRSKKKFARW